MSKWKKVTGVNKPEPISDAAIEQIYDALGRGEGFWGRVKASTGTYLSLGRYLYTHSTFVAGTSDLPPEINREDDARCTEMLFDHAGKRCGSIVAGLMTALGTTSFHIRERDGTESDHAHGIISPDFVSRIYDFSFPLSSARLLQQNIGIRGQELHSITKMQGFFSPQPYATTGEIPNHMDNFMRAYQRLVPMDDQMDPEFITKAFSRIAVVADALKGNEVHDQATARRNLAIAEETIRQAAERMGRELPEGVWDVEARSTLGKTNELLNASKSFREARGRSFV